jgi:hypothetical protein
MAPSGSDVGGVIGGEIVLGGDLESGVDQSGIDSEKGVAAPVDYDAAKVDSLASPSLANPEPVCNLVEGQVQRSHTTRSVHSE